jgi:hypothetical protein
LFQLKINLINNGLAIFYHKNDGVWKVIFPFDNDHKINFSFKKTKIIESAANNDGEIEINKNIIEELVSHPISLSAANREISIEAANVLPPDSPESSDFSEFIDMTANYSHSGGVKLKDGWREHGVLMKVPDAIFFMEQSTSKEFMLRPQNSFIGVDLGTIGEVVGGRIVLNDGGSLALKIDGKDLIPPINFEENADYTLIFDNDCATVNGMGKEDFSYYYNLLEDSADSNLIFEANIKEHKNMSVALSLSNPLIICGSVRVSKAVDSNFP